MSFSRTDKIFVFLIILEIYLYEWSIFESRYLVYIANVLKFIIPVALLSLLRHKNELNNNTIRYFIFYVVFIILALVSSIVSIDVNETAYQWFKYSWRIIFIYAVAIYCNNRIQTVVAAVKVITCIGFFSLLQYIALYVCMAYGLADVADIGTPRGIFYGPFGILGNQAGLMDFGGLSVPILRLNGFWLESSNASGYMFSCFFLANALYLLQYKTIWKVIGASCLIGGILALSNAGYISLAAGLLSGFIVSKNKITLKNFTILFLVLILFGLGFFGRRYAIENETQNIYFRSLAGARVYGADADAWGGRIDLLKLNLDILANNPIGIGLLIPGEGTKFEVASASAPILILTQTGFLGLLFVLLRDVQVIKAAFRPENNNRISLFLFQAWMVVFAQHISYGTWMSPLYLFLSLTLLLNYKKSHKYLARKF